MKINTPSRTSALPGQHSVSPIGCAGCHDTRPTSGGGSTNVCRLHGAGGLRHTCRSSSDLPPASDMMCRLGARGGGGLGDASMESSSLLFVAWWNIEVIEVQCGVTTVFGAGSERRGLDRPIQ